MSEEVEKTSNERIIRFDIEKEMKSAYMDYSMSVIVARALPDARDGLKPVHRRLLFGMDKMGNTPDQPYKKSARIVGDSKAPQFLLLSKNDLSTAILLFQVCSL